MDMKWVEDFLCLADTRSFSRSASERHSSQPAFSRRIRSLETWLGTTLVDRSCNPPTLTPAGHVFRARREPGDLARWAFPRVPRAAVSACTRRERLCAPHGR